MKVLVGDCIEKLKELPDESVNCIVTSPPYYGLRDYGTGEWVGGDPNCPHYRTSKFNENTATGHKAMMEQGEAVGDAIYKTVCPLCGAVRIDRQIGLEETPQEYIEKLVCVFRECRRVLRDDGTLWVNIGDSYWGSGSRGYDFTGKMTEASKIQEGSKGTIDLHNLPKLVGNVGVYKNKDMIGIPWMLAFALRDDGWYLRQDIIWAKPNPMPESVRDRCTKSHEYIFLMSKSQRYSFNYEAIQEEAVTGETIRDKHAEGYHADYAKGDRFSEGEHVYGRNGKRNKRDVWNVSVQAVKEAHFATYPEKLIEPCILAGSNLGGVVLDPFCGSGTTGIVSVRNQREFIGIELNPEYADMSVRRINKEISQGIQTSLF